jgi:hypothetical protein
MIKFCGRIPAAMPSTTQPASTVRVSRQPRSSNAHAMSESTIDGTSLNAVPP